MNKTKKGDLPLFDLGREFNPKDVQGRLLSTRGHDSVYGAYTYEFQIKQGRLYLSVMNRKLQEVTYECPTILPWVRRKRNRRLLGGYKNDGAWREVFADASGWLYQSADEQLFAALSRRAHATSIGTMAFYEEKYRLIL